MPVHEPSRLYADQLRAYLHAVEDMITEQQIGQARKIEAVRQWLLSLNIDPDRSLPFGK